MRVNTSYINSTRGTTSKKKKEKEKEDVPLYLLFTRMSGESHCRRPRSLLLYPCYIFRALINSLVCSLTHHNCPLGLVLFQICNLFKACFDQQIDEMRRITAFDYKNSLDLTFIFFFDFWDQRLASVVVHTTTTRSCPRSRVLHATPFWCWARKRSVLTAPGDRGTRSKRHRVTLWPAAKLADVF